MFIFIIKKLSGTVLLALQSKNPLLNCALITEHITDISRGAVRVERRVGRIFATRHTCTGGGSHRSPAGQKL